MPTKTPILQIIAADGQALRSTNFNEAADFLRARLHIPRPPTGAHEIDVYIKLETEEELRGKFNDYNEALKLVEFANR